MTGYKNGNYSNPDAVTKTINYITRNTKKLEGRKHELLGWGGLGVLINSPECAINCIKVLQDNENINRRGGRRIIHEFFCMSDDFGIDAGKYIAERLGINMLMQLAYECAEIYYRKGHQVVFAIHYDPGKKYHIHFVINSLSFINGLKFKEIYSHMSEIEYEMNMITAKYMKIASEMSIAV